MEADETPGWMVVIILFGFVWLIGAVGHYIGQRDVRVEAVKSGHAEWTVEDNGTQDFRFLPRDVTPPSLEDGDD
jgi:hypothetical protein